MSVTDTETKQFVTLDGDAPIWSRVFTVAPLVLVGTCEEDGSNDFAPKHMAMPVGWGRRFAFVCTPRHNTHANISRTREFTVSFPRPSQVVGASLAAAPRTEDDCKPSLRVLETFPARTIEPQLVAGGYLYLECRLNRMIELDDETLILGDVTAAYADAGCVRGTDRDDQDILLEHPLLAYLSPGRIAKVSVTQAFPFHAGMLR